MLAITSRKVSFSLSAMESCDLTRDTKIAEAVGTMAKDAKFEQSRPKVSNRQGKSKKHTQTKDPARIAVLLELSAELRNAHIPRGNAIATKTKLVAFSAMGAELATVLSKTAATTCQRAG